MSVVKARFLVCPLVWTLKQGDTVAVFLDRDRAEAVVRSVPDPPEGGWRLFPMNELEVLAWLREQRALAVSRLWVDCEANPHDPSKRGGYLINLSQLLDRGKTLGLLRRLAANHEAGEPGTDVPGRS
jgi:hypothetical protein